MSRVFLRGRPTFGQRRDAEASGNLPFTVTEFKTYRRMLMRRYGKMSYEDAMAKALTEEW